MVLTAGSEPPEPTGGREPGVALLTGATTMILAADDCLQVFACADDGRLYTIRQVAPSSGWTGWSSLGAPAGTGALLVSAGPFNAVDGTGLVLYLVGTDREVYASRQVAPGGPWSGWQPAGVSGSVGPVAAVQSLGVDLAFAVTEDGALTAWSPASGWQPVPGPGLQIGPVATVLPDGRVEVFCIGRDDALWQIEQSPAGGTWSAWTSHGSTPRATLEGLLPAVAASADGRLEVFAVAADAGLWHVWQTTGGGWSQWFPHGQPPGMPPGPGLPNTPGLAASADGRQELFMTGTEGAVYHLWQTRVNNGWSGWFPHGVPGGLPPDQGIHPAPMVAASADGRLEVLVVGSDGQLWHQWQTAINNGWTPAWSSHGHP